jgi:ABC-type polysaccharide/polyol phosphate export permease
VEVGVYTQPAVDRKEPTARTAAAPPHESALIAEPTPEDLDAGVLEERRVPKVVPRVEALTTDELRMQAPPRQRYPVRLRRALGELWRSRELVVSLVERDLRVRYKQAVLGVFWAVLAPILTMVLFTIVFGRIARLVPAGVPGPVFFYSVLVPWSLFQSATSFATNSIIANAPIIRKVYCPREVFPIAGIFSSFADFLVSAVILLGFLLAFEFWPTWAWLSVIPLLAVELMLLGVITLLFSGAVAYFRDMRYLTPSFLQVLLFLSPIAYPMERVERVLGDSPLADLYPYLNPLVPILDGFRRALVYGEWPMWGPLGAAAVVSAVLLGLAYSWYKRLDGYLADVI